MKERMAIAKSKQDMRFLEMKFIIKNIKNHNSKMQTDLDFIKKDTGFKDRSEIKQKLIKDIEKREMQRFNIEGNSFR